MVVGSNPTWRANKYNMKYVIAQYLEDVSWSRDLAGEVFVIKKEENSEFLNNKFMPNIGKESYTYISFIVENYERLDGNYCFLQGNPFDHANHDTIFEEIVQQENSGKDFMYFNPFGRDFFGSGGNGWPDHVGLRLDEYFKRIFGFRLGFYAFFAGAQFVVPASSIKSRSKEFYERLMEMHEEYDDFPCVMERIWGYIFNGSLNVVI